MNADGLSEIAVLHFSAVFRTEFMNTICHKWYESTIPAPLKICLPGVQSKLCTPDNLFSGNYIVGSASKNLQQSKKC